MELLCSVDYHGKGINLIAGEKTYGYAISDAVKAELLTAHPTWFTEISALNIAADEALAASLAAEDAALVAEAAAAAAVQDTYDAYGIIIAAAVTARSDAADAYALADAARD